MRKQTQWITWTAVMLALLVTVQWLTRPAGQIVTGSCVNAILGMTALLCGAGSGTVVALFSPVCAFLLGIAPNLVTVPAIMAGNLLFVVIIAKAKGKWMHRAGMILTAAVGKFLVLYLLVTWVVCGIASDTLLAVGILKAPMIQSLPSAFALPQLLTALIGGIIAVVAVPMLKKALRG